MKVYYFNFSEKALMVNESDMVPTSPIYVTFNINPDMEGGGPGSGFVTDPETGRTHNVTATLPEDASYSPLWWVSVYDNADFDNVSDLASAQASNIMAAGVANVNCPVVSVEMATSVGGKDIALSSIRLEQNFPNPFANNTLIGFSISQPEQIILKVFNIHGAQVAELMNQNLQPGDHSVVWDAQNQPGGVYFYSVISGTTKVTKQMTLIK
jgi:hypothetical protein